MDTLLTWLENDDLRDNDVEEQDDKGNRCTVVSLDWHHWQAAHGAAVVPRRRKCFLER